MVFKLNPEIGPDAFVCDEHGNAIPDVDDVSFRTQLQSAADHQEKCKADAVACLQFYFNKDGAIKLQFLGQWLDENQPLDRWFFVHLIEVAGQRFLNHSYSADKAAIARSKNAKPRAWCLKQWQNRSDTAQRKTEFARQFAPLVKRHFGLIVSPNTIARDWLPKVKNSPR